MVVREFSLDSIPWNVTFVCNIRSTELEQTTSLLTSNNAQEWQIEAVKEMVKEKDRAFIQTYKPERKTLILMSEQSSKYEFVDSLIHEVLHLSRHIEMCGNSESLTTALGDMCRDIFKQIYP